MADAIPLNPQESAVNGTGNSGFRKEVVLALEDWDKLQEELSKTTRFRKQSDGSYNIKSKNHIRGLNEDRVLGNAISVVMPKGEAINVSYDTRAQLLHSHIQKLPDQIKLQKKLDSEKVPPTPPDKAKNGFHPPVQDQPLIFVQRGGGTPGNEQQHLELFEKIKVSQPSANGDNRASGSVSTNKNNSPIYPNILNPSDDPLFVPFSRSSGGQAAIPPAVSTPAVPNNGPVLVRRAVSLDTSSPTPQPSLPTASYDDANWNKLKQEFPITAGAETFSLQPVKKLLPFRKSTEWEIHAGHNGSILTDVVATAKLNKSDNSVVLTLTSPQMEAPLGKALDDAVEAANMKALAAVAARQKAQQDAQTPQTPDPNVPIVPVIPYTGQAAANTPASMTPNVPPTVISYSGQPTSWTRNTRSKRSNKPTSDEIAAGTGALIAATGIVAASMSGGSSPGNANPNESGITFGKIFSVSGIALGVSLVLDATMNQGRARKFILDKMSGIAR